MGFRGCPDSLRLISHIGRYVYVLERRENYRKMDFSKKKSLMEYEKVEVIDSVWVDMCSV